MSKFTDFFKKHPLTKHICYMLLVAVLLIIVVLIWLMAYTNHGEQQVVPDVCGLNVESAAMLIEGKGLRYEVIDSVYSKNVQKGCIVEQDPVAGSLVKEDRIIYIVTNASLDRMEALPNVVDISLRQAITTLEAADFKVVKITTKPSEYKDLVLGVYLSGKSVNPGEMIRAESGLELYVGSGMEEMVSDSTLTDDVVVEEGDAESLEEEIVF